MRNLDEDLVEVAEKPVRVGELCNTEQAICEDISPGSQVLVMATIYSQQLPAGRGR